MRKTILLLICSFVALSITSCNSQEPIKETEEQPEVYDDEVLVDTNPIILDSFEYALGDNLPILSLDAKAIEYKLTEDDKNNELEASYEIIGKDLSINILRYKRDGHTIQEAIDAQIETYYPEQGLVGYVFDTWQNDFKCNYGYYMAYDTVTYEEPYYVQTFIFIDGDEFVEADYWYETSKIKTYDKEHFDIPKSLLVKADVQNALDGEILRYECEPMNGIPNVSFYKKENVKNNDDAIIEEYQNIYEDVIFEEYSSSNNGIEQKNLYVEYFGKDNTSIKYYEYMSIIDNVLFSVRFDVDISNGLYDTVGIIPILLSTNLK